MYYNDVDSLQRMKFHESLPAYQQIFQVYLGAELFVRERSIDLITQDLIYQSGITDWSDWSASINVEFCHPSQWNVWAGVLSLHNLARERQ